ncbi:hypothetical protein N7504_000647 [Penicillium tannophilum]|nr:hypothetical protein N7504_000647 [Penicillium tannophilum]
MTLVTPKVENPERQIQKITLTGIATIVDQDSVALDLKVVSKMTGAALGKLRRPHNLSGYFMLSIILQIHDDDHKENQHDSTCC